MTDNIMPFDSLDSESKSIIKVIGVGGGGGNAVNHMYNEGIEGVTFALCNTDNQALARSSIATKLQLGPNVTRGLGAGSDPAKAKEAAEESIDEIRRLLNDGTEMVFITAGMGGGTGTGAAPVVARVAKEMGILTIGIVTLPFLFEGRYKILQALKGVEAIREHVDALMIINNERLRFIYPDFEFDNAFAKADDTLTVAARSIVEIITIWGPMNLDFADVKRTLEDGGVVQWREPKRVQLRQRGEVARRGAFQQLCKACVVAVLDGAEKVAARAFGGRALQLPLQQLAAEPGKRQVRAPLYCGGGGI